MKLDAAAQSEIERYLLGSLPDERRLLLEERLLTDDELFEELEVAEDELIDRYLGGGLSPSDRESFEAHFLLPAERRRKLRFAAALRNYIASAEGVGEARPAERPSRLWFLPAWLGARPATRAFAAAALVIIATASYVAYRSGLSPSRPTGEVLTVVLTPGLVRDAGETAKIVVAPGVGRIRLRPQLEADEHASYGATLHTAAGRAVLTRDGLKAEASGGAKTVALDVPVDLLPPDDYRLKLTAPAPDGSQETVGAYAFRVTAP